jgi:hypothetical protein
MRALISISRQRPNEHASTTAGVSGRSIADQPCDQGVTPWARRASVPQSGAADIWRPDAKDALSLTAINRP